LDEAQKAEEEAKKALATVPDADASLCSSLCADFDWRLALRLYGEVVKAGDDMENEPLVQRLGRSCSPSSRSYSQQQRPIR